MNTTFALFFSSLRVLPVAGLVGKVSDTIIKASARVHLGPDWPANETEAHGCFGGGCIVSNGQSYAMGGVFGYQLR